MPEPALRLHLGEAPVPPPDDRARFEQIVARHHRRLRLVAVTVTGDGNTVDDVLQEAYYRAYRRLPRRFVGADGEAKWLYRIVYNCAIDEVRRRRRRAEVSVAEPPLVVVGDDTVRRLVEQEAFRSLSPSDRAVLLLADDFGFDYPAAARILGVPRGTLAWRLSRARRRFHEALDA
jgi:RNA polymerase sigma-70 factor (ECF subfamily)